MRPSPAAFASPRLRLGFGAVEVAVAVVLMAVLAGALWMTLGPTRRELLRSAQEAAVRQTARAVASDVALMDLDRLPGAAPTESTWRSFASLPTRGEPSLRGQTQTSLILDAPVPVWLITATQNADIACVVLATDPTPRCAPPIAAMPGQKSPWESLSAEAAPGLHWSRRVPATMSSVPAGDTPWRLAWREPSSPTAEGTDKGRHRSPSPPVPLTLVLVSPEGPSRASDRDASSSPEPDETLKPQGSSGRKRAGAAARDTVSFFISEPNRLGAPIMLDGSMVRVGGDSSVSWTWTVDRLLTSSVVAQWVPAKTGLNRVTLTARLRSGRIVTLQREVVVMEPAEGSGGSAPPALPRLAGSRLRLIRPPDSRVGIAPTTGYLTAAFTQGEYLQLEGPSGTPLQRAGVPVRVVFPGLTIGQSGQNARTVLTDPQGRAPLADFGLVRTPAWTNRQSYLPGSTCETANESGEQLILEAAANGFLPLTPQALPAQSLICFRILEEPLPFLRRGEPLDGTLRVEAIHRLRNQPLPGMAPTRLRLTPVFPLRDLGQDGRDSWILPAEESPFAALSSQGIGSGAVLLRALQGPLGWAQDEAVFSRTGIATIVNPHPLLAEPLGAWETRPVDLIVTSWAGPIVTGLTFSVMGAPPAPRRWTLHGWPALIRAEDTLPRTPQVRGPGGAPPFGYVLEPDYAGGLPSRDRPSRFKGWNGLPPAGPLEAGPRAWPSAFGEHPLGNEFTLCNQHLPTYPPWPWPSQARALCSTDAVVFWPTLPPRWPPMRMVAAVTDTTPVAWLRPLEPCRAGGTQTADTVFHKARLPFTVVTGPECLQVGSPEPVFLPRGTHWLPPAPAGLCFMPDAEVFTEGVFSNLQIQLCDRYGGAVSPPPMSGWRVQRNRAGATVLLDSRAESPLDANGRAVLRTRWRSGLGLLRPTSIDRVRFDVLTPDHRIITSSWLEFQLLRAPRTFHLRLSALTPRARLGEDTVHAKFLVLQDGVPTRRRVHWQLGLAAQGISEPSGDLTHHLTIPPLDFERTPEGLLEIRLFLEGDAPGSLFLAGSTPKNEVQLVLGQGVAQSSVEMVSGPVRHRLDVAGTGVAGWPAHYTPEDTSAKWPQVYAGAQSPAWVEGPWTIQPTVHGSYGLGNQQYAVALSLRGPLRKGEEVTLIVPTHASNGLHTSGEATPTLGIVSFATFSPTPLCQSLGDPLTPTLDMGRFWGWGGSLPTQPNPYQFEELGLRPLTRLPTNPRVSNGFGDHCFSEGRVLPPITCRAAAPPPDDNLAVWHAGLLGSSHQSSAVTCSLPAIPNGETLILNAYLRLNSDFWQMQTVTVHDLFRTVVRLPRGEVARSPWISAYRTPLVRAPSLRIIRAPSVDQFPDHWKDPETSRTMAVEGHGALRVILGGETRWPRAAPSIDSLEVRITTNANIRTTMVSCRRLPAPSNPWASEFSAYRIISGGWAAVCDPINNMLPGLHQVRLKRHGVWPEAYGGAYVFMEGPLIPGGAPDYQFFGFSPSEQSYFDTYIRTQGTTPSWFVPWSP